MDLLAAIQAQNRAADQKKRHIGADLGGNLEPFALPRSGILELAGPWSLVPSPCTLQFIFQPHQRRNGIGRARAQSALHRSRLSIWISTSAVTPSSSKARSIIFQAVLRLSVGTRLSFEVSRSAVCRSVAGP